MPQLKFSVTDKLTAVPNLLAIFHRCIESIEQKSQSPIPGLARVTLVMPGLRPAQQMLRYLCGKKSPKGEIVSDGDGETQIVSFDCTEILAWMTANELITTQTSEQS